MARGTEILSQDFGGVSKLPPTNPVSPATASTIPALGTVSTSLNPGVTATLIGGAASQAAAAYPSIVSLGSGIINDPSGKLNAVIGILGKTPKQLEAAGILKPGAGALVTGLVQRGMSVKAAMTNNLFTGMPGAESLKALVNNIPAQASAQITNFQQAQTAMTMAGVLKGNEAAGAIAGIVNAASHVGVGATVAFLKNSVSNGATSSVSPATRGSR
jgi:hypothetical protein